MGCLWSSEGRGQCVHCNRKAVNNLVIINNVCEICTNRAISSQHSSRRRPKFGEYSCGSCGRFWNSRLSWPDKYQMCKRCHHPVMPYKYRDLNFTDLSKSNEQEHIKELCQMCQQLGYNCKVFGKEKNPLNDLRALHIKSRRNRKY